MERSISTLAYKGSISSAIIESQKQKKLFLVYISGEDENSIRLEQSTWVDQSVAESISKYCILLHLVQGSVDVSQFSALYPQKSVPSISAVGHNGVMLWQHDGHISAENFVKSIEKAWAALHVQETAVTLLTAALASKKPEALRSSSPDIAPFEQGNSSTSDAASTSADKSTQSSEARPLSDTKLPMDQSVSEQTDGDRVTKPDEGTCVHPVHTDGVNITREEKTSSASSKSEDVLHSVTRDTRKPVTFSDRDGSTASQEYLTSDESHSRTSLKSAGGMTSSGWGSPEITAAEVEERTKNEKVGGLIDCSNVIKSDDVHLNIRLPNGASFQRKFIITDTLRSVKNYVDENQISGLGSYDLAVPYPRRVFNEQDMRSAISELGFASRQALIVVPHRQASAPQGVRLSTSNHNRNPVNETDSSDDGGGYFGYVKRILSYVNPFSYLGGASSSSSTPSDSLWQHRPNPALQNNLSRVESTRQPYSLNSQNPSRGNSDDGNTRRSTSRPFGSNIHTLRHSEDDPSYGDRNTFWNGNSTQFGGDDGK